MYVCVCVCDSTQPLFILSESDTAQSAALAKALTEGNTVSTDEASSLMKGALQLVFCCGKPQYDFSSCIVLMGRSGFVSLVCTEIVHH